MKPKKISTQLLEFGTKKLDKESQAHLLVETAKACYVMSRPILDFRCIWYFSAAFFVMHHSLESFIKAFLLKENISFEYGQKGHELLYLFELGNQKSNKLQFLNEILNNQQTKALLTSLDNNYCLNKYWEVGFNTKSPNIVDIFDKIISIFTKQFHLFYGNPKREPSIDVPEEPADLIEHNRKYSTTLCILPKNEN